MPDKNTAPGSRRGGGTGGHTDPRIIAREYGLPCVRGADRILNYIHTGDRVTVDGFLGIVTCETDPV